LYYADGIGVIEIIQYSYPIGASSGGESQYVETYNIRLEEAYPSNVNDLQMAWGDDGYAKLNVEITYRYSTEAQKNFYSTANSDKSNYNKAFQWLKDLPPGAFDL
jgi:hypothetical protein